MCWRTCINVRERVSPLYTELLLDQTQIPKIYIIFPWIEGNAIYIHCYYSQSFEWIIEFVEHKVDPRLLPVVKQSVTEFATLGIWIHLYASMRSYVFSIIFQTLWLYAHLQNVRTLHIRIHEYTYVYTHAKGYTHTTPSLSLPLSLALSPPYASQECVKRIRTSISYTLAGFFSLLLEIFKVHAHTHIYTHLPRPPRLRNLDETYSHVNVTHTHRVHQPGARNFQSRWEREFSLILERDLPRRKRFTIRKKDLFCEKEPYLFMALFTRESFLSCLSETYLGENNFLFVRHISFARKLYKKMALSQKRPTSAKAIRYSSEIYLMWESSLFSQGSFYNFSQNRLIISFVKRAKHIHTHTHTHTHTHIRTHTRAHTHTHVHWRKRCTIRQRYHSSLCVAVCCSMLQYVAVCCSVLQCGAGWCNVMQCVAVCCSVMQRDAVWYSDYACCTVL